MANVKNNKNGDIFSLSVIESFKYFTQNTLEQRVKSIKNKNQIHSVFIFKQKDKKSIEVVTNQKLKSWQWTKIQLESTEKWELDAEQGKVILLFLESYKKKQVSSFPDDIFSYSDSVHMRQFVGEITRIQLVSLEAVQINFSKEFDTGEVEQALVGLELGLYQFLPWVNTGASHLTVEVKSSLDTKELKNAIKNANSMAKAINFCRHLVNAPASSLNPKTYVDVVKKVFSKTKDKSVEIKILDNSEVIKQKMGLLQAVGKGATHPPCVIHIQYRPKSAKDKQPIALVGKGITYDTGGLDIKPSPYMRNMKKDMGGSATVIATALWAIDYGVKRPLDFYLAIAENAISNESFRPGDVYLSRSGKSIEIDNTDAEGRLAVADVLDYATTQKLKPQSVVDVCTLTGAIKHGLCAEIMGLFANNKTLSNQLMQASNKSGEEAWLMPLYRKLLLSFQSQVATMTNSSGGYGGAIKASLFLESFTNGIPWAHFDIYAWRDSAEGPFRAKEAHGQGVLLLSEWLKSL